MVILDTKKGENAFKDVMPMANGYVFFLANLPQRDE